MSFLNTLSGAAVAMLLSAVPALATTYTFDTASDLTDNFNLDVISGDLDTEWRAGYAASGGFEGSDGGFVMMETANVSNSLQFKTGPVTLHSFDISLAYGSDGAGQTLAALAQNDFRLVLYDTGFNALYDQILPVSSNGAWDTLTFDIANVSTIWIDTFNVGAGILGWFPNVDNITVTEASTVPLPGGLPLIALALGALGIVRRRR